MNKEKEKEINKMFEVKFLNAQFNDHKIYTRDIEEFLLMTRKEEKQNFLDKNTFKQESYLNLRCMTCGDNLKFTPNKDNVLEIKEKCSFPNQDFLFDIEITEGEMVCFEFNYEFIEFITKKNDIKMIPYGDELKLYHERMVKSAEIGLIFSHKSNCELSVAKKDNGDILFYEGSQYENIDHITLDATPLTVDDYHYQMFMDKARFLKEYEAYLISYGFKGLEDDDNIYGIEYHTIPFPKGKYKGIQYKKHHYNFPNDFEEPLVVIKLEKIS
jgi:hypothetical protein